MLPLKTFKAVVASTPLISIDMILRNGKQEILLGRRINRPAKGYWFVPGGRVLKDETIENAYKRLLKTELAINECELVNYNGVFKGVYQHFYEDNVTGSDFSTHYIVLAYEIEFDASLDDLPNEQHNDYRWFSEVELFMDRCVHKHTKWYFQEGLSADTSFVLKAKQID